MTEKTAAPPKKTEETPEKIQRKIQGKSSGKAAGVNWAGRLLLLLCVFLLGAGAVLYFLPSLKDHIPPLARWMDGDNPATSQLGQKVTAFEHQLARQDSDIQALKTVTIAPAPDPRWQARLESLEQEMSQITAQVISQEISLKTSLAPKAEQDSSQSGRIDMLLNRMSQLEASFVPLSKGLAEALDARLEQSRLMVAATSQTKQLVQIESRLSKVETYAARDNSGALLAFRVAELRNKVSSGMAFGPELDALKAMTEQGSLAFNHKITTALDWLAQHKDGITPQNSLRDQFNDLIPAMIQAGTGQPDDPWWMRAYNSTKNLIMVRKTENADGDLAHDLDNIIARAHKMLTRFDLQDSLALLKELPQNIRDVLDVWIMRAEIYLQAHENMDQIESLTAAYYLENEQDGGKETAETPL